MLLHGIFPPITTPFYPDGKVYFKKLEHNVERYSKTPVAGLAVLGSTGEYPSFSAAERKKIAETALKNRNGLNIIICSGTSNFPETIELSQHAAANGTNPSRCPI